MTRILRDGDAPVAPAETTSERSEAIADKAEPVREAASSETARRRPGPSSKDQEYFSGLFRELAALTGERESLTVGVTSCSRHAGVTSVSLSLAAAAAREIRGDVLLVDANFDSPGVGAAVRAPASVGFADLLTGEAEDWKELVHSAGEQLDVLPSGSERARRDLSVHRPSYRDLLDDFARHYELIVLDLPMATEVTACFPLGRELLGVLLVIEAERTRNQAAARATKQLRQADVAVLGAVFNKRRQHVPDWIYRRI